jgi:hypothetical protein
MVSPVLRPRSGSILPLMRQAGTRFRGLRCLGTLYTQNPGSRQWAADWCKLFASYFRGFAVDCGVEKWVVVHLELPVKLEAPLPVKRILPQLIETLGQVGSLFFQDT